MHLNIIIGILAIVSGFTITASYSESEEGMEDFIELGIALAESEKFEEALSYFDKVLENDPKNLDALHAKAVTLGMIERYDESLSYLEKILEQEPDRVEALSLKGQLHIKLEQYDEALSYFDKVLDIQPDNIPALNAKGVILAKIGKFDEAISYFEQVLSIQSDNHQVRLNWFNTAKNLSYDVNQGSLIVQVRDSNGSLISYQESNQVRVVRLTSNEFLRTFDITDVITIEGQKFNVYEKIIKVTPTKEDMFTKIKYVQTYDDVKFVGAYSIINGGFVREGDSVILKWTILRPA